MKKQLNIRVFGKVQGVYFRQSTKEKANSLNITGVVMNEADGSVYISAVGEENDLALFIAYCKAGPPLSKVENVHVEEADVLAFNDFRILH